ncbi:hypothetical protein [Niabella ginsenosidivorans]|nr:hypothetical protein [Niabella ginsenosidivorans]
MPFFVEQIKVPKRTIERWLTILRNENKIEFRGAPKTGGYWKKEG